MSFRMLWYAVAAEMRNPQDGLMINSESVYTLGEQRSECTS